MHPYIFCDHLQICLYRKSSSKAAPVTPLTKFKEIASDHLLVTTETDIHDVLLAPVHGLAQ